MGRCVEFVNDVKITLVNVENAVNGFILSSSLAVTGLYNCCL